LEVVYWVSGLGHSVIGIMVAVAVAEAVAASAEVVVAVEMRREVVNLESSTQVKPEAALM
jgi:hypothetical protein